jgi:hypothetical protein
MKAVAAVVHWTSGGREVLVQSTRHVLSFMDGWRVTLLADRRRGPGAESSYAGEDSSMGAVCEPDKLKLLFLMVRTSVERPRKKCELTCQCSIFGIASVMATIGARSFGARRGPKVMCRLPSVDYSVPA